ncbi:MAG: phospho-N-acetylmuramoyl-pentapeptide-transferase [Planctomycetota bacterium]|nr:phospho-N-acetylmuramoyl-pentapeptide-transferase [Planctomycetota bacterium]
MLRYLSLAGDWFGPLRVFDSLTVRASAAAITAFLAAVFLGPVFIRRLALRRATEDVNKPDAAKLQELHRIKKGTPTMGGVFLVAAVSLAALLYCDPLRPLVWIGQFVILSFAGLGFIDDYWKLRGWGRQGLKKRHKFAGEIGLALLTTCLLAWGSSAGWFGMSAPPTGDHEADFIVATSERNLVAPTRVVIPFTKWNEVGPDLGTAYWFFTVLILVACSNAVNLTDGLDGLASGCTAMVAATYSILAYIAGNAMLCAFFRIPLVPGAGELFIFGAALFGGLFGFLWHNANPAQVFMGDTGSLAIGATLAYLAIATKHELILIVAGGIFVFEALSVILQVASFRLLGRRLFKIAPFHHHLEYSGWKENHVVVRLWIVGLMLAIVSICLLKMH